MKKMETEKVEALDSQENNSETSETSGKWKKRFRRIWDVIVVVFGVLLFVMILAFFQTMQEANVKKERKESVSLEKTQKEVENLYQSEKTTTKEVFQLYKELRKAESKLVKKASTPEEKTKILLEVSSMKQDLLMLKESISFKNGGDRNTFSTSQKP